MRRKDASFGLRLLTAAVADRGDVDSALAIFVRNTSPLLRTKTNQIRAKIASPETQEGRFYFAAFYRGKAVIGFSMFGYYPGRKLIVVDHMVIDGDQRGHAAFYVFSQLLHDAIHSLSLDVDFTVVEVEKGQFGGDQTGGEELVRLLGQVGFGQVYVDYVLANMEPYGYQARYEGTLMLRGEQKLYGIRREDLVNLYRGILFDHYLPWYRDFFGEESGGYQEYLERIFRDFERRLRDKPVVKVNGPERDVLIRQSPAAHATTKGNVGWYLLMFAFTAATSTAVLYFLKTPPYLMVPVLLALLAVFAGVVVISRGDAAHVLDRVMSALLGGKQKSRYRPIGHTNGNSEESGPQTRDRMTSLPNESPDKPN